MKFYFYTYKIFLTPKKNEGLNINRFIRVYKEMAQPLAAAPLSSNLLSLLDPIIGYSRFIVNNRKYSFLSKYKYSLWDNTCFSRIYFKTLPVWIQP